MGRYRLTFYISTIISIYCLFQISPAVVADCDKCEALPPDCQPGHDTPFSGGPPCTCTRTQQPQGCILKPCEHVTYDSLCDCSRSIGSVKHRSFCRKYRCTGESGHSQSCKDLPPDCTVNSYNNPPATGGPECSCSSGMTLSGCTMKPCIPGNLERVPCISKPGEVSSPILYGTTCPGNLNSTGGGGNIGGARGSGWVLVGVGGVLLTLGVVVLKLSMAFLVGDHLLIRICRLLVVIGLIHLVIGVLLLGIGLWVVFK